jgi:hypothetical protein
MAYVSDHKHTFGAAVYATLSTIGTAIATFLRDIANANSRYELIEELRKMDARTLRDQHGIDHGQIVSYVFRDKILP